MTLTLTNLTKQYGNFTALENFTYDFTAGVYGLLGPNGAGKSTLMNIITDNLKPTSGSVKFDGVETSTMDADFRKILGFMPQQQGIYPNFTLERFLYYMAALKGMKKADAKPQIEKLINLVNLQDSRNKRLGGFSGGMPVQFEIVAAQVFGGEPGPERQDRETSVAAPAYEAGHLFVDALARDARIVPEPERLGPVVGGGVSELLSVLRGER